MTISKKGSLKSNIVIIAVICALLSACASPSQNDREGILYVYDLSSDMSHIIPDDHRLASDINDVGACVGELLQRIIDGPSGGRRNSAIPNEITSVTYYIGPQTVGVNFNSAYNEVPMMRKILCEAAIVRTLCQLDQVYAVSFSVEGVPVCDSKGIPLGLLTPESFIENDGSMINAYERAELHLFFADEEGKSLVEKAETVTYNSNIPLDRLVVDNVISGPKSTDAYATVNPATQVNSVMTQDGVCYVNLDSTFLNKITNVTDEVMIYSIVNSLTALDNINKVQILIDGEMNVNLGEFNLSTLFERNLSI